MSELSLQNERTECDFDAIVVGAGIAGLYQLYRLRELGYRVRSIEAAPAVGGTWYWNCYPGARVDSQSHVYQYWFSDELIQEWDWSERFPAQPETERYLNFVADKFELHKDIQFSTQVISAIWDETGKYWKIGTDQGETITANFLVSCAGMLSAPVVPLFEGYDNFKGQVVHTARYPREGIDFAGKTVGVIGCGATGIQVIQTIASQVGELKVFQRTPSYGVAMRNEKLDDEQCNYWCARAHELEQRVHHTMTGFDFGFDNGSWYDLTPEERKKVMEYVSADGSLAAWVDSYREICDNVKQSVDRGFTIT